jgi:hypothetical protein
MNKYVKAFGLALLSIPVTLIVFEFFDYGSWPIFKLIFGLSFLFALFFVNDE